MTIIEAILSGIVQGVSEFFPISSSGHLAVLHSFFGFKEPNVFFDVCLHLGTLLAIVAFFRKDIAGILKGKHKLLWAGYFVLATLPAVIAGVLFERKISVLFVDIHKIASAFIITAFVLFMGQLSLKRDRNKKDISLLAVLIIGLAQAFALVPGISRSGITISAGIMAGIDKEKAFSFSFLIAMPAIVGAVAYNLLIEGNIEMLSTGRVHYIIGTLTAFIVGFICLPLLKKIVQKGRLAYFGIYCLILGIFFMVR